MILGKERDWWGENSQQNEWQVQGPAAELKSVKCEILNMTAAASQRAGRSVIQDQTWEVGRGRLLSTLYLF